MQAPRDGGGRGVVLWYLCFGVGVGCLGAHCYSLRQRQRALPGRRRRPGDTHARAFWRDNLARAQLENKLTVLSSLRPFTPPAARGCSRWPARKQSTHSDTTTASGGPPPALAAILWSCVIWIVGALRAIAPGALWCAETEKEEGA